MRTREWRRGRRCGMSEKLRRAGLLLLTAPLVAGPWLFGAWEKWWFWPLAGLICAGFLCFAAHKLLLARQPAEGGAPAGPAAPGWITPPRALVLTFLPFLLYASIRAALSPVWMDAERSLLLFVLPFAVGIQIVFGTTREEQIRLFWLTAANLLLLGLYGIVNHRATGSQLVLWAPGFPQYYGENRASGSYFCPDHYSGLLELAYALALAALLSRDLDWQRKVPALVLAAVAVLGVLMSKSRGGGLTLLAVSGAALIWGFDQWPTAVRWWNRSSVLTLLAIVVLLFARSETRYMIRFRAHFGWNEVRGKPARERLAAVATTLRHSCRGEMYAGALRAWRTAPIFGIGAGMHRHRWSEFAASPDGSREDGRWPAILNNDFHSYEVHSDWIQLLEEYGIAGVLLFLAPAFASLAVLRRALRAECRRWKRRRELSRVHWEHTTMLGAMLAWVAMAFHSWGDFNLQLPATTWLLGAILAVPLAVWASRTGPAGEAERGAA